MRDVDLPILPDWDYLLSLPPPFENAIQGTTPNRSRIIAPPTSN